jgi:hypothetical protein
MINSKEFKKETMTEKATKVQSEPVADTVTVTDTGFESEGDILSYGASVMNHGDSNKGSSPISAGNQEGSIQIEHSSLFDGLEDESQPVFKQVVAEKKTPEKKMVKKTLSQRASKDELKTNDLKIDI